MENSLPVVCPVCNGLDSDTILNLNCGNIDNSKLYSTVKLKVCLSCGHSFNELSPKELEGLNLYYNEEYAPANLTAIDIQGDRPGSDSSFTTIRFNQLFDSISFHISSQHKILDVGCALGGFLDFLSEKGFPNLYGIDMTETYVNKAKLKNTHTIKLGEAAAVPFEDNTFDVVVMEQVLEHLFDPITVFQEIKRVLKKGGIFCVGVPDASRYSDFNFFDYYWILLREHLQHFDAEHLKILAESNGFKMIETRQTEHFVMSEKMTMPNLYAVFRSTDLPKKPEENDPLRFNLKEGMRNYIETERKRKSIRRERITKLIKSRQPVYIWGIGREFLYLYEAVGLKYCNIAGLIDKNELKKKNYSIDGIKITGENILEEASTDSVLIITAFAHVESIKSLVKELGFKGEIFDFE